MGRDFIARKDGDFALWVSAFSRLVSLDPEHYNISIESAAEFAERTAQFQVAYVRSASVATKTRGATADKDSQRKSLEKLAREIAKRIRGTSDVTEAERIALGLGAKGYSSRPSGAPNDPPMVSVNRVVGNVVTIHVADPAAPSRIARPRGVARIMVFKHVGNHPPANVRYGIPTLSGKTTFDIVFPPGLPPGTKLWIFAQYLGYDHTLSPLSQPTYAHISSTETKWPIGLRHAA